MQNVNLVLWNPSSLIVFFLIPIACHVKWLPWKTIHFRKVEQLLIQQYFLKHFLYCVCNCCHSWQFNRNWSYY